LCSSRACVIESEKLAARWLEPQGLTTELGDSLHLKSSYDKATHLRPSFAAQASTRANILKGIRRNSASPSYPDRTSVRRNRKGFRVLDVPRSRPFCAARPICLELARHARVVTSRKASSSRPRTENVVQKVQSTGNRTSSSPTGISLRVNNLVSEHAVDPDFEAIGLSGRLRRTHSCSFPAVPQGLGRGARHGRLSGPGSGLRSALTHCSWRSTRPGPCPLDGPNTLALDSLRELLTTLKGLTHW